MGRRSDHSRAELKALLVENGHALMEEVGFARFSAREVAKRVGYSIGTIYNVFESHDALILAINAHTLDRWATFIQQRLDEEQHDTVAALVFGYCDFAQAHPNTWLALYDHRLEEGGEVPEWYREKLATLMALVTNELLKHMPENKSGEAMSLARSLIATVHGHCVFIQNGTFSLLGEKAPRELVLARVRESLAQL